MRKYIIVSFLFLILGLVYGVFYREFSKQIGVEYHFSLLSNVHGHTILLGCIIPLIIGLVINQLKLQENKFFKISFILYIIGVFFTSLLMLIRGIITLLVDYKSYTLSKGLDITLSTFSGIFHIVFGVGIICMFIFLIINSKNKKQESM